MSTPEELARVDREYIDTQSFWGDLHLLAATVIGGGYGDAAVRERRQES